MKSKKNSNLIINEELLDLTLTDIVILQTLVTYSVPTTRFKILEDLNDNIEEESKLKPTKFYYSLKKLQTKGLLNSIEGDKKREELCTITSKGKGILSELLLSLTISHINYRDLMDEMIPKFIGQFDSGIKSEKFLVILSCGDVSIDSSKFDSLSKITEKIYIASNQEQFDHFIKRNPHLDIIRTDFMDDRIREADNYFDVVLYIDYENDYQQNEARFSINELSRIVKTNGMIIFSGFDTFDNINHFILNPITKILIEKNIIRNNNKKELLDLFKDVIIKEKGFFEYKGFYLIWGVVK